VLHALPRREQQRTVRICFANLSIKINAANLGLKVKAWQSAPLRKRRESRNDSRACSFKKRILQQEALRIFFLSPPSLSETFSISLSDYPINSSASVNGIFFRYRKSPP